MKFVAILLVLGSIIAIIVGPQAFFTVNETQVAIVTRFGEVTQTITSPGLKVKTPFVESVTYFDSRLLIWDAPPEPLLTGDKKRLIIDVYARGRIVDPKRFRETLRTEAQAASRAVDIISSELRTEIASDNQSEIITTKREDIMRRVLENTQPKLKDFGLEVVDLRIKRADFPVEIADSVYARMQAERKRKADRERAEGAEIDATVRAQVDREATVILAKAQRDADITRGCGEAKAISIFAEALERDPEFYTFQRSLEAYKVFLTHNTTIILPVGGFGQLFEDIRQGILEGTELPVREAGSAESDSAPAGFRPPCEVEAAARLFLSTELNLERTAPDLLSAEKVDWTDSSLGCPDPDKVYAQAIVPGFSLVFKLNGDTYEVHSNQDGSALAACES